MVAPLATPSPPRPHFGAAVVAWGKRLLGASWGATAGVVLALLTGYLLLGTPLGASLVNLSYDLPYALRPNLPATEVIILRMDEDSHDRLQQPYLGGWNRAQTHARLLDRLRADGAKAVVFDIVFSDPSVPAAIDEQFTQAIQNMSKVVLAADVSYPFADRSQKARKVTPPLELLSVYPMVIWYFSLAESSMSPLSFPSLVTVQ